MVNRKPPRSVFILAFDQCDELDVVGPTAVLQTANRYLKDPNRTPAGEPFALRIVSVDGSGATCCTADGETRCFVTGIHGITATSSPARASCGRRKTPRSSTSSCEGTPI